MNSFLKILLAGLVAFVASFLLTFAVLVQGAEPSRIAYIHSKAPDTVIVITPRACPSYGHVAMIINTRTESVPLEGCWFGQADTKTVTVSWSDGDVSVYPIEAFKIIEE